MEEKAVVAVSFGSTVEKAEQDIIRAEQAILKACPDRIFVRAYSSGFIRKRLQSRGTAVSSPREALEQLCAAGVGDILVQPTFVIPGTEYDRLCEDVKDFSHRAEVRLGSPLLESQEDLTETAKILRDHYLREGAALLLMGHGTEHPSNRIFAELQTAFRSIGEENCYLATVESRPTLEDAIRQMKQDGALRVILAPLLLTAGDHVMRDMAGEEPTSWLSRLSAEGFSVDCRGTGLAEIPKICERYRIKTQQALQ